MTAEPAALVYSRVNPSPRYRELTALYRSMHLEGDKQMNLTPERTFTGQSLIPQLTHIKPLVMETGAKTMLDYGAGKGQQYGIIDLKNKETGQVWPTVQDYLQLDSIRCYDPGNPPFSELPTEQFDGVICTDVLEHCPEEDMPWIIDEIFSYATKFVFANAACYPAKKMLPNGENAHCTIRPVEWWRDLVKRTSARYPQIKFLFFVQHVIETPQGSKMMTTILKREDR